MGILPGVGVSRSSPTGAAGTRRPATYSEVFASGEYRAVLGSAALSWIGDYFTKVAVSYLVFTETRSVFWSAAAFAIGYLPWVLGPVLSAIADRYPYRRVMVAADLARMVLVAAIALTDPPVAVLIALLFATAMFSPPAEAARSALLPTILSGDRYVVGVSVQKTASQLAQVLGYSAGGVAAAVDAQLALLVDAATFAASALLLMVGVRPHAVSTRHPRATLLADAADGFRVVFTHPVLRAIALLVFAVVMFPTAVEGLAASWVAHLGGGATTQGALMAAVPVGTALGAVVVGRLVGPDTRLRLVRPLALVSAAGLVPALLDPGVVVAVAIAAVAGFGTAAVLVPLNGLFVEVLPAAYRARAFGIMQGGVQLLQGIGVLAASLLGGLLPVPVALGTWGALGVAFVTVILLASRDQLVTRSPR